MLKVKNLTHLTPQKLKKSGNFDHGCKKNQALLDFFCNLVSRFGLILTKILFSISNERNFKALALLLIELWSFSPHNL